jgi:hypothetical protein
MIPHWTGYNDDDHITEASVMPINMRGVVKNGVIVPDAPLPEGARVDIRVHEGPTDVPAPPLTPTELRRLSREHRQAILAAAAELAEQDYASDRELTGFDAFSEEEQDDDESDAG